MLSIANITSSSAALSYYEEDDYYAKGSVEHQDMSGWYGKGAQLLGLEGVADRDDFKNILEGKLRDGTQLGVKTSDGSIKHAVGIDMTFSAPKSVSIMVEIARDEKIYAIHKQSVQAALKYTEENFLTTRVKIKDTVIKQSAKTMVAATMTHNTSRNLDPQLHTHCVVANIVQRDDGKWRSAWLGDIFDNKKLLGVIYRAELARGLIKIGYQINRTHDDGRFEIAGVSKDLIDIFSTRSKEIREALENYDYKNAKTAANATLKTRELKQHYDREELNGIWLKVLENKGYNKDLLTKEIFNQRELQIENSTPKILDFLEEKWQKFTKFLGFNKMQHVSEDAKAKDLSQKIIAKKSIEYALEFLGERNSVFLKKNILSAAISYSIGKVKLEEIAKAFENAEKDGVLIKAERKDLENFYTTKEALEKEHSSILMMKNGRGKVSAISDNTNFPQNFLLNKSQKNAAEFILKTQDKVVAIQGYAGVGKTYTLNAIREVAAQNGYKMIGMAPSASAALTLQNDAKINSQTIHKFLFKYDGLIHDRGTKQGLETMKREMKKTILVLDEASLASTNQINSLLKVVNKLDVRLVMVGDVKQLGAIEAGKPFYQLQKAGMKTVVMEQIIRQKDMELKAAVEGIIKGEVSKAFANIRNIIEEKNEKKLIQKVVEEFIKLSPKDRENTLILAPANETREAINKIVREKLQEEKSLKGEGVDLNNLKQKDLTKTQKADARNYGADDVVLFNKTYKSLAIKAGDYLKVQSVNQQKGEVILEKTDGKVVIWDPEKVGGKRVGVLEVYTKSKINLKEGDSVIWKRNSKKISDIINSESAIVKKIENDQIVFQAQNGKEIELKCDNGDLQHIDHGYATTVYSAQGKTADNVIAVAESHREYLTSQKSFYVTISRARNNVTLVVDDKQKVADRLFEHTGERISALESQKIHESHIQNQIPIHHTIHEL